MSDQITAAVKRLDDNGDVLGYHFTYAFDGGGANLGSAKVYVPVELLDSETDVAQAVSIANVQAAGLKAAWLSQFDATVEFLAQPVNNVVGNVSL